MHIAIYENGKLIKVVGPKPKRLELVFVRGNDEYSSATSSMSQGLLRSPTPKQEVNNTKCQDQGWRGVTRRIEHKACQSCGLTTEYLFKGYAPHTFRLDPIIPIPGCRLLGSITRLVEAMVCQRCKEKNVPKKIDRQAAGMPHQPIWFKFLLKNGNWSLYHKENGSAVTTACGWEFSQELKRQTTKNPDVRSMCTGCLNTKLP